MGSEVLGRAVTPRPWRPHTPLSAEQPGGTTHLALVLVLGLLATCEQLADAFLQLLLPLAHLVRVHTMIGGDFLDRLAATGRIHGNPGLELGAVVAAPAHWWEPLSGALPRLRG
jgi:hypothetical protein